MMSHNKLRQLCVANETIAKAYAAFRKIHPLRQIDDIWEQAHFVVSREEVCILSCGRRYSYIDGRIQG